MLPHITFTMVIIGLRHPLTRSKLWQETLEELSLPEILQSTIGVRHQKHLGKFIEKTCAGELLNEIRKFTECDKRLWMILAMNARTKPHSPKKPKHIMPNTNARIPNKTNESFRKIFCTRKRIENLPGNRMEIESIDGEIPSLRIRLTRPKDDCFRTTTIGYLIIFTKSSHLKTSTTEKN